MIMNLIFIVMELLKWCISHLIYGSLFLRKRPVSFMLSELTCGIIPIILWLFFWCVWCVWRVCVILPASFPVSAIYVFSLLFWSCCWSFSFTVFQRTKFLSHWIFSVVFMFSFSLISDHVFIISFLFLA